jgi:hypothetical protein
MANGGIMRVPFQGGGRDASQADFGGSSNTGAGDDKSYQTHHPNIHAGMKSSNVVTSPASGVLENRTLDLSNLPKNLDNINAGIQLIRFAKDPSMGAFMKWMGGPFGLIYSRRRKKNCYAR